MGKIVAKVVLTGGPCAGKTSALSKIESYFTERGYKVLIVGESATEIIKSGIKTQLDLPVLILLMILKFPKNYSTKL